MTIDPSNDYIVAFEEGQRLRTSVTDRFASLQNFDIICLSHLAILYESLAPAEILKFLATTDLSLNEEEMKGWLLSRLKDATLTLIYGDNDTIFLGVDEEIRKSILTNRDPEDLRKLHTFADQYYEAKFRNVANLLEIKESGEKTESLQTRDWLIKPNGFIENLSHLPQHRSLHSFTIISAAYWEEHLFQLGKYEEAADLTNSICFSLARQGYRQLAEDTLARIASVTKGIYQLTALLNLSILLREDLRFAEALAIMHKIIPGLIFIRAFNHLAIVLSEIGVIYHQQGKQLQSVMALELSGMIHFLRKSHKSQAIAYSQLASTYRNLQIFSLARWRAQRAIQYLRGSGDLLNLGRTLITQGNIFYKLNRSKAARKCFEEAACIGEQIEDPQTIIDSISGQARTCLLTGELDQAEALLKQAILLRERYSNHHIGVEYENLGHVYEMRKNVGTALAWYKKALESFEKYLPGEVENCRRKINRLETQYMKRRNNKGFLQ